MGENQTAASLQLRFWQSQRGDATEQSHTHALAFYFSLPLLSFFLFFRSSSFGFGFAKYFQKGGLKTKNWQYPKFISSQERLDEIITD